jgi:toxin ParE1/3/4
MTRYNFTARAAEDLREIGGYTKGIWGAAQARRYRQELELALQKLSLNPDVGRQREEIAPQIRSFRVASHIAFYVPRKGGITVIRLLHPRMDIEFAFDPLTK